MNWIDPLTGDVHMRDVTDAHLGALLERDPQLAAANLAAGHRGADTLHSARSIAIALAGRPNRFAKDPRRFSSTPRARRSEP